MNKTFFTVPLAFLLLFTAFFIQTDRKPASQEWTNGQQAPCEAVFVNSEGQEIKVFLEIADEKEEWTEGLMFRTTLLPDRGMLFIFPDENERSFWMKNTFFPLDIIFLNKDKQIVHIERNAQPCQAEPCELYKSPKKAQYVIEVNAGFCRQLKIEKDNFADWR